MIPGSIEAAVVIAVAVLPGAVYTWIYEREAGSFEVNLPDRLLRFAFASAALHVVVAPPLYAMWWVALRGREGLGAWQFLALWGAGLMVLAVSATAGHVVGVLAVNVPDKGMGRRVVAFAVGRFRPPRAWDAMFHEPKEDYLVRARLRDGRWVGGLYASQSSAGRFPQDRQDLLIEQAYLVDDAGRFVDRAGAVVPRGREEPVGHNVRLLLNWDSIDLLRVESEYVRQEVSLE